MASSAYDRTAARVRACVDGDQDKPGLGGDLPGLPADEFGLRCVERLGCRRSSIKIGASISESRPRFVPLSTEAEWEYAAKAGRDDPYCFGVPQESGEIVRRLDPYSWSEENSGGRTHPVGQKKPNRFGLFDMNGNVCEWVGDRFDPSYYARSPRVDPAGPERPADATQNIRVNRLGSFANASDYHRNTARHVVNPVFTSEQIGFRVARSPR